MLNFKNYRADTRGNFGIMFAFVGSVLAVGVAVAVDVSSMLGAKDELQNNLDSAALAAVIEVAQNGVDDGNYGEGNDEDYYKALILNSLEANGYDLKGKDPTVIVENGALTVNAKIPHTFQFGALLNKKSTIISGHSKVAFPSSGSAVEIALVLDNTESMNHFGKMTALKVAAKEFIEAVEDSNSGSKIALVPFARYVDIGIDKRGEPWLEVPVEYDTDRTWQQATHTGGTCHIELQTRFDDGIEETFETEVCTGQTTTYEEMMRVVESRWIGCVGVRSNGLHMLDDSYVTSTTKIQGLIHITPHEVTDYSFNEEAYCPHTITPLTNDFDLLDSEIYKLYGTDRTYIPAGLIWGQRILSPKAPFSEADTVNPKRQIMILMSDGDNTGYLQGGDDHESIPYVQDLSEQEQADDVIPVGTNEDTAALCESIKSEGVEIYTIAFQVKNALTRELLLNCASSNGHYDNAESNEDLIESFRNISEGLGGEIRLMQ